MPKRPCLDCGKLSDNSRCTEHQGAVELRKLRAKRERRPRLAGEDARRRAVVAAHRRDVGDWCPGWHRPPHAASDLTADHPNAVGAGGSERQALAVLCRVCNGAKGSTE